MPIIISLQPVFRDGIEFQFTLFIDLAQDHAAFATKDRTTLFDGKYFKITRETGDKIRLWLNSNEQKSVSRGNEQETEAPKDVRERNTFVDNAFAETKRVRQSPVYNK